MKSESTNIRTKIECVLVFSTAGVSIFIAVADLLGILDANSWIAQRLPSLTLLAVGFIASYLILERRGKISDIGDTLENRSQEILKTLSDSSSHIIKSLDGVEVVTFNSNAELARYASKKYCVANQIEDVTWGEATTLARSREDIEAYNEYQRAISTAIRNRRTIWREVAMFRSLQHWEREKVRIFDEESAGYSIAYYKASAILPDAPRLEGFAVIDNKEVLVALSGKSVWLSIKHPDIARYFSGYFEDLWQNAIKLKIADKINAEEVEQVEVEFKAQK